MIPVLYLAYGSNLSTARFRHRLPGAEPLGAAQLEGYSLHFHKRGMDGSAKCNALADGGRLWGVLYRIGNQERTELDRIEGLGRGYRAAQVTVSLGVERMVAHTYLATRIDGRLQPFDWYREHVLRGAREWTLPDAHIERIRRVATVADPDPERVRRELSVYAL